MSTPFTRQADASTAAVGTKPNTGLLQRLMGAREREAAAWIGAYLAGQTDQSLRHLGYTREDVEEMREGRLVLRAA